MGLWEAMDDSYLPPPAKVPDMYVEAVSGYRFACYRFGFDFRGVELDPDWRDLEDDYRSTELDYDLDIVRSEFPTTRPGADL